MNLSRTSKKLTWLLRHGATEARISMDPAGWISVDAALRTLRISRELLDEIVRTDGKQRMQLREGRVRACQGHSQSVPVTQEALEASWVPYQSELRVWHGTFLEAVPSIAREGILAGERTHVHLAPQTDSVVGKRSNVHVMLGIDPRRMLGAGQALFVAPNGVVLAREVPAPCIDIVRTVTKRAEKSREELAALFTLMAS